VADEAQIQADTWIGTAYREDPNDAAVMQVNAEEIEHQLSKQLSETNPGRERLEDESVVRLVVVHPHMYPNNHEGGFAWAYSTPLDEDDGWDDAWVLSAYQDFRFYGRAAAGDEAMVRHVLYTAFFMLFNLGVCESTACVMNNSDSVDEAAASEAIVTLCPVCLRAVQLQGAFDDGLEVLRNLAAVLGSELFRKSKKVAAQQARLHAWIRASAPA
jgi:hypothetical protein